MGILLGSGFLGYIVPLCIFEELRTHFVYVGKHTISSATRELAIYAVCGLSSSFKSSLETVELECP